MPHTMRHTLVAVCAVLFLASSPAFAQQQPEVPAPPAVSDPMLVSVARAQIEIATWEDALGYVRSRSSDLKIALQEVQRAEAQQRVALAGALPSLTANGTYTRNLLFQDTTSQVPTGIDPATGNIRTTNVTTTLPPQKDFATGTLFAVQPVLALRAWHAIGTASIATDAAKLSLDDTKRLIALGVANAIVGVVTAERVAELNRVGLLNSLQRLELTTRKQALGGATGLDVVRARQDVEASRATLVAGDEQVRQARESLGLALGVPEQVGVPPSVDISGLEAAARATCKPAPNVDERPDVAAAHTQVDLAHRAVNDVKYQFAPTVNLQSALGQTSIPGATPATTWNVQAVLSIPLFEGGARYGNLRVTQAQEAEAVERLQGTRRTALIQIEQARRGVSVAEERRRVSASARDLAADTDRLTRLAYQEGRGTSLELVDAARALRAAEIDLALRDFDVVNARVLAVLALATCPW
jgi:outer membrane protein TolC